MKKIFASLIFLFCFSASSSFCAEKPILVRQPAYSSMKFYVYKPAKLQKDFYVTYDGYLVYKASDGVWYYGSADRSGIVKTGFVVGSVVPSVVNLRPYDAKISSTAPVYKPENNKQKSQAPKAKYIPPQYTLEIYEPVNLSPNAADWTRNSNFMAMGKWQKSIDRMGILERPYTPIAWKGDHPEVIYAWNGLQWIQIMAKGKNVPAMSTLRRGNYDLTIQLNKLNLLSWNEYDSHVLSQYSMMWGYKWLGLILVGRNF